MRLVGFDIHRTLQHCHAPHHARAPPRPAAVPARYRLPVAFGSTTVGLVCYGFFVAGVRGNAWRTRAQYMTPLPFFPLPPLPRAAHCCARFAWRAGSTNAQPACRRLPPFPRPSLPFFYYSSGTFSLLLLATACNLPSATTTTCFRASPPVRAALTHMPLLPACYRSYRQQLHHPSPPYLILLRARAQHHMVTFDGCCVTRRDERTIPRLGRYAGHIPATMVNATGGG